MKYKNDVVAAISTPPGKSGIAVIRVSGNGSIELVNRNFSSYKPITEKSSHTLSFGKIHDAKGHLLDEVVVGIYRAPKSYTGEDVVEISCHGNTFIARRILDLILEQARLADPGEFTQRAFFNNKLDLTQTEAVADLLDVKTKRAHETAIAQLDGSLERKIEHFLKRITNLRTELELEIDFVEQGLETLDEKVFMEKLKQLKSDLRKLIDSGEEGRILREGFMISLVGAPNVGKSSIFNAFLKTERAIVTPVPGTTRDYIEEVISLNGYMVRLFDTAGLRNTDDKVEKIGIERSEEIIKNSHKILFISDNSDDSELNRLESLFDKDKIIKVINKTDLLSSDVIEKYINRGFIPTSTVKEKGLSQVKSKILEFIEISDNELKSGILTNSRQINAVKKSLKSINKVSKGFENKLGYEFIAFDLKEASSNLEKVVGRVTNDDILHKIFSEFCVGK